jgi:hypothetical protein
MSALPGVAERKYAVPHDSATGDSKQSEDPQRISVSQARTNFLSTQLTDEEREAFWRSFGKEVWKEMGCCERFWIRLSCSKNYVAWGKNYMEKKPESYRAVWIRMTQANIIHKPVTTPSAAAKHLTQVDFVQPEFQEGAIVVVSVTPVAKDDGSKEAATPINLPGVPSQQ